MTKQQANFFKIVTEYCGNQNIEVTDSYSGRGMFGKQTYGVVINSLPVLLADCIQYVKETADCGISNLASIPDMDNFKTDNMGMDIILY